MSPRSVDVAGAQHDRPVQLSHRQRSGVSVPATPRNVRLSPVSKRLTSAVDRRPQGKRSSPCHRCTSSYQRRRDRCALSASQARSAGVSLCRGLYTNGSVPFGGQVSKRVDTICHIIKQ